METSPIKEFRGDYFFLSNYSPAEFVWSGAKFNNSEQAFAFAKTYAQETMPYDEAMEWRQKIVDAKTPGEAKKIGRNVPINLLIWERRKFDVMADILKAKFNQNPDLTKQLTNTWPRLLIEGNDWHDTTWGRCYCGSCVGGHNVFGVLLMELRGTALSRPPF